MLPANIVQIKKSGEKWIYVPNYQLLCRAEEFEAGAFIISVAPLHLFVEKDGSDIQPGSWLYEGAQHKEPVDMPEHIAEYLHSLTEIGTLSSGMLLSPIFPEETDGKPDPEYQEASSFIYALLHTKPRRAP